MHRRQGRHNSGPIVAIWPLARGALARLPDYAKSASPNGAGGKKANKYYIITIR